MKTKKEWMITPERQQELTQVFSGLWNLVKAFDSCDDSDEYWECFAAAIGDYGGRFDNETAHSLGAGLMEAVSNRLAKSSPAASERARRMAHFIKDRELLLAAGLLKE